MNSVKEIAKEVKLISGQNVFACYQCGRCSSACPMTEEMDLLPNQIIRLVQMSDDAVLSSVTPWICASCLDCTIRCPRGIDVAKVMEAIRQLSIRRGIEKREELVRNFKEMDELPQILLVSAFRKYTG
ncbi:MAG TPA: heterodisulfide reductase [Euryarchaeota archaeon]|nr:MAG: heterodisulfide reductase [Thermococci archaeon]RLF96037.1 MAG: heterodisulfide reductase [Thermococci archaeon]HDI10512.1 heterodisulfide reductase [Euryarchaeota archaeon]